MMQLRDFRWWMAPIAGWTLAALLAPWSSVDAQVISLATSSDITTERAAVAVNDHDVVVDDLNGGIAPLPLGPIPSSADVTAFHRSGDTDFVAFDVTVDLGNGSVARQGDAVAIDDGMFSLAFIADVAGVPAGARVDAYGIGGGGALLSFDTTVDLGGLIAADEDLVAYDTVSFTMVFDGSAEGIAAGLDLDAAHQLPGTLLALSFDGTGIVDGIHFDDEDVLIFDTESGIWLRLYDGSAADPGWTRADLDALFVTGTLPTVFLDGFESGTASAWSKTVP